jgi:hypothetical protein
VSPVGKTIGKRIIPAVETQRLIQAERTSIAGAYFQSQSDSVKWPLFTQKPEEVPGDTSVASLGCDKQFVHDHHVAPELVAPVTAPEGRSHEVRCLLQKE